MAAVGLCPGYGALAAGDSRYDQGRDLNPSGSAAQESSASKKNPPPASGGTGDGVSKGDSQATHSDASPSSPSATPSTPATMAPSDRVGAPLPDSPPPLALDPRDRGVWRGNLRLDAHLMIMGPLGGASRASGNAYGVGGGVGLSIRPLSWLSFGPAFAVASHYGERDLASNASWVSSSTANYFDLMALRLYWPNQKRVQPFVTAGGGYFSVDDSEVSGDARYGGQWRAGVGLDAWLFKAFNVWTALRYRNLRYQKALPGTAKRWGHRFELCIGVGMHL